MDKKAQIAIEFLLLVAIAFAVVLILLVVLLSISEDNTKTKSYYDIVDLGNSLQQEFLLAAELEDGYTRRISLPATLNGLSYNIAIGNATRSHYYLALSYNAAELYYLIPPVNGTLVLGNNFLIKENNTLKIIQ